MWQLVAAVVIVIEFVIAIESLELAAAAAAVLVAAAIIWWRRQ